jgi:hypothetical protein
VACRGGMGVKRGGEVGQRWWGAKLGGGAQCASHLVRGGEDRGVRMSAVELAGGVVPFYKVGEAGRRLAG